MLIASIKVENYETAKDNITEAARNADGIELRLDYAKTLDMKAIDDLCRECNLPFIFTLRKESQGGYYTASESQRLNDVLSLCELKPAYFDLEYDVPNDFIEMIKARYPNIKLICSYHDFDETPKNLDAILQSMQHPNYDAYKIATKANNTIDALRMLHFVNTTNRVKKMLTGLCMGEDGQCTRIVGKIVGNAMTYASLDAEAKTADGQLTLHELINIYRIRKLNKASKIYALLGDPIDLSVGHHIHNQAIETLKENAVYIKLRAKPSDLEDIIQYCRRLPFCGFSITMPHKEVMATLADDIEADSEPIKAINSITLQQGKYVGFNTDGKGAIQAITEKMDIEDKTIVVLGAGGAARAIAYEAIQQKAKVIILNRTLAKAQRLADELNCEAYALDDLSRLRTRGYHIIVNTLPASAFDSDTLDIIHPNNLLPKILSMDIVYQPLHTPFLKITQRVQCTPILGYKMYIHQALLQLEKWFELNNKQCQDLKIKMIDLLIKK